MSFLSACVARNEESSLLQTPQRESTAYIYYVVFVLFLANVFKILPRPLLGVLTTPMSQELHYGEQRCMSANETISTADIYLECTTKNRTQCEIADINATDDLCKWDYDGHGVQFELLAGPVFIVAYSVASLPQGFLTTIFKRHTLLAATAALWSAMTLFNGLINSYWQLVLTTICNAIGQAGSAPTAVTLIYDYVDGRYRTFAMGVLVSGHYVGAGLAYVMGNFITASLGWRWSWIIGGLLGLIVAFVMLITIREPQRTTPSHDTELSLTETTSMEHSKQNTEHQKCCGGASAALSSVLLQPAFPTLCFATFARLGAFYVWGNNAQLFYQDYGMARETIGAVVPAILAVGSSVSVILGGFVVDRYRGDESGLPVIITSQAIGAFFSFGTVLCPPPYSFVNLAISFVVGEFFSSAMYVVVIDLVPAELKGAAIGVFMFISQLGGIMVSLVPPLRHLFSTAGYGDAYTLKAALLLLYPGLYVISAILYFLTLVALRYQRRHLSNGYERHRDNE